MVAFRRRRGVNLKFHGLNPARPVDSDDSSSESGTPDKSHPEIKCGEQEDCPLRSKCKAGLCPPGARAKM